MRLSISTGHDLGLPLLHSQSTSKQIVKVSPAIAYTLINKDPIMNEIAPITIVGYSGEYRLVIQYLFQESIKQQIPLIVVQIKILPSQANIVPILCVIKACEGCLTMRQKAFLADSQKESPEIEITMYAQSLTYLINLSKKSRQHQKHRTQKFCRLFSSTPS
eukprot:TRINITY_DN485_c0_g1_i2.p2 TRINITY_DN485_c0_g1~~TRINITY_DN485_c0_g1_i2.p2  ORF type:complete len:162 (+),score=1.06 TRINITY_DN485_c0_g1_i2:99-584(+)